MPVGPVEGDGSGGGRFEKRRTDHGEPPDESIASDVCFRDGLTVQSGSLGPVDMREDSFWKQTAPCRREVLTQTCGCPLPPFVAERRRTTHSANANGRRLQGRLRMMSTVERRRRLWKTRFAPNTLTPTGGLCGSRAGHCCDTPATRNLVSSFHANGPDLGVLTGCRLTLLALLAPSQLLVSFLLTVI